MYVCGCAYVYMNIVPTETKTGCWSPGARVTDGCELPDLHSDSALNHRVICPDPLLPFLIPPPHLLCPLLPSPIILLSFSCSAFFSLDSTYEYLSLWDWRAYVCVRGCTLYHSVLVEISYLFQSWSFRRPNSGDWTWNQAHSPAELSCYPF